MTLHDAAKIVTGKVCPRCSRQYSASGSLNMCPHDQTLLSVVTADPFIGKVVAGYQIDEVLGAGGWSVVYKAHHTKIHRSVAIKVLHPHLVRDKDKVARFQREAEAATALLHPSVATVFDYGVVSDGGQPYIIMEYLEGRSLSELLKETGALPPARALGLFKQALEGLGAAHEKGVVHRDIKPSNIFVSPAGKGDILKILDFGLAKLMNPEEGQGNLTQTGETMGTPDYMSPEQCLGQALDSRSDLYSFGYVMYEVLTGKQPVTGKNAFESMHSHIYDMPRPMKQVNPQAGIPEALEAVVFKALAKKPGDRYQSAGELWEALEKAVHQEDRMPALLRRGLNWLHRRRLSKRHAFSREFTPANLVIPGLVAVLLCGVGYKYVETLVRAGAQRAPVDVNPRSAWESYFNRGTNALNEGDLANARKYLELADRQARRLGEQSDQYFNTLNKLLAVYTRLNDGALVKRTQQRLQAVQDHYYYKFLGTKDGNTEKIVKYSEELLNHPESKQIASQLAGTLNDQAELIVKLDCNYDKAQDLLKRAQTLELKYLGAKDPEYARTLNDLSISKFAAGRKQEAIDLSKQALAIRRQALGPDDPRVARSLRTLADWYQRTGRYKEAEDALRQAMDIYARSKTDGPTSENYAWALNNLGVTQMNAKQYFDARRSLNQALRLREALAGPDSVDVARTLCNLGLVDYRESRAQDAIKALKRACDIFEQHLGAESEDTATTSSALGHAYLQAGDFESAEKYLKRALNTLLSISPKSDDSLRAYQGLEQSLKGQGKLDEAARVSERVKAAAR